MTRAPIITIMGHVDHGKTTLLDSFRTDHNKCATEYGAITQAIGAFTIRYTGLNSDGEEVVEQKLNKKNMHKRVENEITFIDTPGHEAFQNMRSRGAKVTDMIILVISAVESVQKQTIEVIELARDSHIPLIVAINKIDRPEADVEAVMLDLAQNDLIPQALGGEVLCVPISAKEGTNMDELKQKIKEVSSERVNLLEDYTTPAQCIVIESDVDEKSGQITATVIVKKGTLNLDDLFVSGIHEGKVRLIMNDVGKNVNEAFPGEAVHMTGFKVMPEVGNPLYVVKTKEESNFIINRVKQRSVLEAARKLATSGRIQVHDIKARMGKLTRLEKRAIKGGDKSILYEKLGLLEEKDLSSYYTKFGIKKGEVGGHEDLAGELESKSNLGRKGGRSRFKKRREQGEKDHFVNMMQTVESQKEELDDMDDEERNQALAEKAQLKAMFREDDDGVKYYPLIIKANQAGSLETLLTETVKIIGQTYQVSILESGVGPISEADISQATSTGAVVIGFDVPCSQTNIKKAEALGVPIKLHKLIYKFTDDLNDIVHDVKLAELEAKGQAMNKEVVGVASILDIFEVTVGKGSKQQIFGSKALSGELQQKQLFQVTRYDDIIADGLQISNLKHHKKNVSMIEKGQECGISFVSKRGVEFDFQRGDVIECYQEVESAQPKFQFTPGMEKSF